MLNGLKKIFEDRAQESYRVEAYKFDYNINIEDKIVSVRVSKMYGLDGFINFGFLLIISEFLKTEDISVKDEYYTPGCESCNYGSCGTATIIAKNVVFAEREGNEDRDRD